MTAIYDSYLANLNTKTEIVQQYITINFEYKSLKKYVHEIFKLLKKMYIISKVAF